MSIQEPGPSVLACENGWLFLQGDTNKFLTVQFGERPAWSAVSRAAAAALLAKRAARLQELSCRYLFVAAPEKSVVYPDFLPKEYRLRPLAQRPAQMLQEDVPRLVVDAETFLKRERPAGPLFFRGDTHMCWLGAWFLYRAIAERLADEHLLAREDILRFDALIPTIAAFEGDLTSKLALADRQRYEASIDRVLPAYGVELCIRLDLPLSLQQARSVNPGPLYSEKFPKRATVVYENARSNRPLAVIFRDSTSQYICPWLAQHFRRAVFVWHQGQVYEDVIAREHPDIVLHIMAERFVTSLPSSPAFIPADA